MTGYNKLASKVNGTDATKFVSRTKYEKDGSDLEKKPDISGLAKKHILILKVTEIEVKIPSITGLATN